MSWNIQNILEDELEYIEHIRRCVGMYRTNIT